MSNVIIHHCEEVPKGRSYYGSSEALYDDDLERLQDLDVDEVWYWYVAGSYEGSGQLLMRKGDKYDIHDMGHCSCYGPVDYVRFDPQYSSLDEIRSKCSEEAYQEVALLVEMAGGKS